jgi:hypothetical protein
MNINITFVLQIANFWITYMFLKKLIFRPFLISIRKRDFARKMLLIKFKEKENQIIQKTKAKEQFIKDFRDKIKINYHIPVIKYSDLPQDLSVEKFNNENNESMMIEGKNFIVSKVSSE